MTSTKRVLVTGATGYIGSVVCQTLLRNHFEVIGVDKLLFGVVPVVSLVTAPRFSFVRADLLDAARVHELVCSTRPDVVVHLAAIVGDPASRATPELTRQTNLESTRALVRLCERSNVRRFVFASTCSNYGRSNEASALTEEAPLDPLSLYAETKVIAENELLTSDGLPSIVVLRFATAHGLSPRMRFDLTVNQFTRTIWGSNPIDVYDANTWRPYCHVNDFGDVIDEIIQHPALEGRHVFNVGSDYNNYSKSSLISTISEALGKEASVRDIGEGPDQRNYKVAFGKISRLLPAKTFTGVADSARAIAHALDSGLFPDSQDMAYANA